jgi:hypothetical protein
LNVVFEVFPRLFDKVLAARFHILQQVEPTAGELVRIGLCSQHKKGSKVSSFVFFK